MGKQLFIIIFSLFMGNAIAQIEPELLLGLTNATSLQITDLTGIQEGQVLYNSDTKEIVFFNGTSFISTTSPSWFFSGNAPLAGSFLGTTNDVTMEIRSNNIAQMQFGRRQTLGLTQAFTDYDDDDQYIAQLLGSNGVSALQFQADAASFYKPMFFTTTDGNFRLKGSAAGTDFFEIGSTGVSNAGEFEFIIGDDGLEPFIFKRFDYRDQLKKELFRIQGSSDTQNALPRIGINTGQLANSTLEVNGSLATSISTPSANITLDESHFTILLNSNITVTLPAASSVTGRVYVIKNTTATARTISTYINSVGGNSTQIEAENTLWLQSNGVNWNSLSPSGQGFVTNLIQDTATGTISYVNENNTSQTANVVSTDDNNSIGVGSDGGAYLKINYGGRWTNANTTTNLNINNTVAAVFGNENYKDDNNNLYEVIGNTLVVKEAGRYHVIANLSLLGINSAGNSEIRTNVNARIAVNGIPLGALGASGYIRFGSNHTQSSVHLNEILELTANDIVTVITYREANSGTVRFSGSGESSFSINKLR